ncbi:MAG: hypothetical protein U9O98_02365 [Asgard group archaeon]|nr:hypothetical protein [Asgard group archaeon]
MKMSLLYFFTCPACKKLLPLFENQQGWVDQNGQIKNWLPGEDSIKLSDRNNLLPITLFDALCLKCDIVYTVCFSEFKKEYNWKNMCFEDQKCEAIPGEKIIRQNGLINGRKVYHLSNNCPRCKNSLLTGSELAERVRYPKKSTVLQIFPDMTEDNLITCPTCQQDILEYYQAIRYH